MFSQLYSNSVNDLFSNPALYLVLLLISIWSLIWKGFALWKAAKNNQRNWFIALLVLNTIGILEIIYIFYLSKSKPMDEKHQNIIKNNTNY